MIKYIFAHKWVHLVLPAVIVGILIPFCFKSDLVVFPGQNKMDFRSYIDTTGSADSGGTVISKFDVSDSLIDLSYTIGGKNIYPYAGFQWIIKKGEQYINVSDYDHLIFSIRPSTNEEVIIVILQFFVKSFSKVNDHMTWQYLSKEIPLKEGQTTYSVPLSELQTPLWWFNQYKLTEKEFGKPDFSKLGMISIEEGSDAVGVSKRIVLNELRFEKKSGYVRAEILLALLCLFYILYVFVNWFHQTNMIRKKPIVIPYQQLAINDDSMTEERKVLEYLGNKFSNQLLSLSVISEDLGISSSKISTIIKNRYNLSFRQYLNTIRIAESKRLLQETKLQISQIAYKVGYTNLTHFCRTFKEVTTVSPNTFRQDSTEAQKEDVVESV